MKLQVVEILSLRNLIKRLQSHYPIIFLKQPQVKNGMHLHNESDLIWVFISK